MAQWWSQFFTTTLWYGLKAYTYVELQLQKLWRTRGLVVTSTTETSATTKWIFVLRGEQVVPTIDELKLHRPTIFNPIFYALPSVTGSTTMVRITADSKAYDLFQLRECPTAFYAMSLNINDGEYVLNVPTNQQNLNFLVANNVLYDRPFWQWYMLQFHQLVLEATDKYWVHFFDDQMTVVSFSHRQCMRLNETGYEIIDAQAQAEPQQEQEQAEPQQEQAQAEPQPQQEQEQQGDGNETDDSMPDLVSRSIEQLDDDVLLDDETVLPVAEDNPEALNESSASLGSAESAESAESSSSSEANGAEEFDLVYVDLIDKKNL